MVVAAEFERALEFLTAQLPQDAQILLPRGQAWAERGHGADVIGRCAALEHPLHATSHDHPDQALGIAGSRRFKRGRQQDRVAKMTQFDEEQSHPKARERSGKC